MFYFLLSIPLVADFLFGKMESTHREYDWFLGYLQYYGVKVDC